MYDAPGQIRSRTSERRSIGTITKAGEYGKQDGKVCRRFCDLHSTHYVDIDILIEHSDPSMMM